MAEFRTMWMTRVIDTNPTIHKVAETHFWRLRNPAAYRSAKYFLAVNQSVPVGIDLFIFSSCLCYLADRPAVPRNYILAPSTPKVIMRRDCRTTSRLLILSLLRSADTDR